MLTGDPEDEAEVGCMFVGFLLILAVILPLLIASGVLH